MSLYVLQHLDEAGEPADNLLTIRASLVPLDAEGLLAVHGSARNAVETMHGMGGVGIAWPQIGVSLRAFVSCPSGKRGDERVFVNPEYFNLDADIRKPDLRHLEGCLSVCGGKKHVHVPRFSKVFFHATELLDWWKTPSRREGRGARFAEAKFFASGLEACVLQHETDHLDGILLGGKV